MFLLLTRGKNEFIHSVGATAAYKRRRETQEDESQMIQSANYLTVTLDLLISKFLLTMNSWFWSSLEITRTCMDLNIFLIYQNQLIMFMNLYSAVCIDIVCIGMPYIPTLHLCVCFSYSKNGEAF